MDSFKNTFIPEHSSTPAAPPAATAPAAARLPRVTKLMALVIRYDRLVQTGYLRDFADLMNMGQVSNARISQIMNLRHLAPDIQEALLFLPLTESPRDPISERDLRPLVAEPNWEEQRKLWNHLVQQRL